MSHLIDQTQNISQQARAGITTHNVTGAATSAAQSTLAYPRGGLSAGSSRDEIMREKVQYQRGGPQVFGELHATDADFRWLQKKRDIAEKANLDAWIGQNFHRNDVAARKWLQEVYPEYYESRERLMADRAKLALRIHLLKLRGPKNEKDLILQWGLQTGRIELEPGWDRIGYTEPSATPADMATQRTRFGKHLFKPWRLRTDNEKGADATAAGNPFRATAGTRGDGQHTGLDNFPGITNVSTPMALDNRYTTSSAGLAAGL